MQLEDARAVRRNDRRDRTMTDERKIPVLRVTPAEAKRALLLAMSHELRTPMNIILGFSKLMTGESKISLSPDDVREYADNIHASGTHLLKLINDIIDYSTFFINQKRIF